MADPTTIRRLYGRPAGHKLPHSVEFDETRYFAPDESVEIKVHGATRPKIERVRSLEEKFVFEEAVDAFAAAEAHRLKRRATKMIGYGGAVDLQRAHGCAAECG